MGFRKKHATPCRAWLILKKGGKAKKEKLPSQGIAYESCNLILNCLFLNVSLIAVRRINLLTP